MIYNIQKDNKRFIKLMSLIDEYRRTCNITKPSKRFSMVDIMNIEYGYRSLCLYSYNDYDFIYVSFLYVLFCYNVPNIKLMKKEDMSLVAHMCASISLKFLNDDDQWILIEICKETKMNSKSLLYIELYILKILGWSLIYVYDLATHKYNEFLHVNKINRKIQILKNKLSRSFSCDDIKYFIKKCK